MLFDGAAPFFRTPEKRRVSSKSILFTSTDSCFDLEVDELNKPRETEACVISEFGVFDFIIYGEVPRGGITCKDDFPSTISRGSGLVSS